MKRICGPVGDAIGANTGRLDGRSVVRSVGLSVCRSVGRSIGRSVSRSEGAFWTADPRASSVVRERTWPLDTAPAVGAGLPGRSRPGRPDGRNVDIIVINIAWPLEYVEEPLSAEV